MAYYNGLSYFNKDIYFDLVYWKLGVPTYQKKN